MFRLQYNFVCESLYNTILPSSNDNNNNKCYQQKESVKSPKREKSIFNNKVQIVLYVCLFICFQNFE